MEQATGSQFKLELLGVKIDDLDVKKLNSSISKFINEGKQSIILHVNVYGLNLAYENSWLRDFYNSAEIVFCDGAGVILGARLLGYKLDQRITYADWTWNLAEFMANEGLSLFLLGAKPGIAQKAAQQLTSRYGNLRIVGTHHGYFDKKVGSASNEKVIKLINELKPDILIVGFGMPIQEKWLEQNWTRLDSKIALTGGAVFDYVSGELKRAPRIMTDHSLEWLGRLLIEPKRLWKRYIIGNPLFIYRILRQKFITGF